MSTTVASRGIYDNPVGNTDSGFIRDDDSSSFLVLAREYLSARSFSKFNGLYDGFTSPNVIHVSDEREREKERKVVMRYAL